MAFVENLPEVETLGEIFDLPGPIAEDALLLDDNRVYSQLAFAFEHGGEYAIADAINVLEKYYGVLALNDKRSEEIVELLEAHQETSRGADNHLIECHIISTLIRMSLERELPDFDATHRLFHVFDHIHFSLRSQERIVALNIACSTLQKALDSACSKEYFPHVQRFLAELKSDDRNPSFYDDLRRVFVTEGYINF